MSPKFALLEYAPGYDNILPGNKLLFKSKTLRNRYIRTHLPYNTVDMRALGVDGIKLTLPITAEDAEADERLKNDVFMGVLGSLRQSGIRAVKAGFPYPYDSILPASSGFYVLPFLLPVFLRKCAKMLNKSLNSIEVLIIDGIFDLSIDILCVISNEINHITVITENTEGLQNAANGFYSDSGLYISIMNRLGDANASGADIILNASAGDDGMTNRYKKGAFFLDMAGNNKKITDISMRRTDIFTADGLELKKDGEYADNILLETVMLADNESFRKYVSGRCGDADFYSVLDYIESQDFTITSFLRGGKRAVH